jgi:hypothetical protein
MMERDSDSLDTDHTPQKELFFFGRKCPISQIELFTKTVADLIILCECKERFISQKTVQVIDRILLLISKTMCDKIVQ